jgi:hypothetical protein
MRWHFAASLALPALFAAGLAGCDGDKKNKMPDDLRAVLESADQFELLSLSPDRLEEKPKDGFHGWKVLGKTTVQDAETRKKLVAALQKGVEENTGIAAGCFNPRHGIRVTRDGQATDFVICFECLQVEVYSGETARRGFLVTNSPQPAFDAVLKEAKLPLAEPAK